MVFYPKTLQKYASNNYGPYLLCWTHEFNRKSRHTSMCASTRKDPCLWAKEPLHTAWDKIKIFHHQLSCFPWPSSHTFTLFSSYPSSLSVFPSLALLTSNTHTHTTWSRERDYALCISRGRFCRLENNYMTEVRFLCRQLATFGSFANV